MSSLPPRAGRRCHQVLNPLHSALYFSPDLPRELAPYGIDEPSACYFAVRSAAMGAVGAGVVTATFYGFHPDLVARHVPLVWEQASPEVVLSARLRAVDATLRRLLGEETLHSPEMAEAAELALGASRSGQRPARPLYAAECDLPVPDIPHLKLWQAITRLREHRGDGHLAVLLDAELDPVEAQVSHTASGHGMTPALARRTRGHSAQEWAAAQERLRARGLLDAAGELTPNGVRLRKQLEEETDRLDRAPYEALGARDVARLTELCSAFTATALAAGAFPAGTFGTN